MNDECEDVIRRIDGCQRIDPSHPATGLPGMSDDMWRACVDALRADGYPISSYITPEGKRGYFLGMKHNGVVYTAGATDVDAMKLKKDGWK